MKKLIRRFPIIVVCAVSVLFMALFAACSGVAVPTTNSPATVTGTIKSVNTSNGSVTLTVNGQDVTINGLSSAQVSQLQSQVGKTYSITAVQNSDGSYTLSTGSNTITIAVGTPAGIQTPSGNGSGSAGSAVTGTISFIGKVQSVNGNSIVVSMPDSSTVSLNIVNGTTNLGDNNVRPTVGQYVKVDANANTDGSYTATSLKAADPGDTSDPTKLNTVDFQGVTTSSVGSDNKLNFTVGNKSYSFAIGSGADLSNITNGAQGIQANQMVKVEVLFSGSNGSVTKVKLNNPGQ